MNSLTTITEELISVLQNRPEIIFAILYGSATEGASVNDEPLFNDLDIGLFVNREQIPANQDLDYTFDLTNQLEQVTPHPVDVRIINNAPLPFQYNVSKGIPLITNDPEIYFTFLEQTWDKFLDFRPVAMQYLKDMS